MVKVYRSSTAAAENVASCALAIGNFDGVHLGHQALLRRTLELAHAHGLPALALTFDPHPSRFFRPDSAPLLISTERQKVTLLGQFGIDAVVLQRFDAQLAGMSAEQFIEQLLVRDLRVRDVVVGSSFVFGRGRTGSVETLRSRGQQSGFEVHGIDTVEVAGGPVSSTRIRDCIDSGAMDQAKALLGRAFEIRGRVVSGAGRGRTIGIPTANLEPDGNLLPARGVYAGRVSLEDGQTRAAVINVGYAPTFGEGGQTRVEAHILQFEGDLLGQRLTVTFLARLREEKRFANADELVGAIRRDIERANQLLDR